MFSALFNHIKLLRTEIRLPVATICVFMTFLKQFSSLYAETRVLRADAFRAFGVFASNHWPLHVGQSLKVMWASFHIKFKPSTYYITQIKRKQNFFIDWKTTLVESYQSESWFRETPPSTYWPEALEFLLGRFGAHIAQEQSPNVIYAVDWKSR